jgi:nucleoside-diphosphate-sugar epimerase
MRVLLTGKSGFLGSIIFEKLRFSNDIVTLGRGIENAIRIADFKQLSNLKNVFQPVGRVIHVAGLAHKEGKSIDALFDEVNHLGTISLCNWVDSFKQKPKQFIFISSVSVYGKEFGVGISELDSLEGKSPYALSKIHAEEYLRSWGEKNGIAVLILRLPLIVGSNPPGNLGKMINGIKSGKYFSIGTGGARKSMVLADDVAELLLNVPFIGGTFNLTDGYHPSFFEMESLISNQLSTKLPINLPLFLAKMIAKIGDMLPGFPLTTGVVKKITSDLIFSDNLAKEKLNWNPNKVIEKFKL